MAPYVDCLIVEQEEGAQDLALSVEVYAVAPLDILVVDQERGSAHQMPDKSFELLICLWLYCLFPIADELFLAAFSLLALLNYDILLQYHLAELALKLRVTMRFRILGKKWISDVMRLSILLGLYRVRAEIIKHFLLHII